jgi:hypothetical protein
MWPPSGSAMAHQVLTGRLMCPDYVLPLRVANLARKRAEFRRKYHEGSGQKPDGPRQTPNSFAPSEKKAKYRLGKIWLRGQDLNL